MVTERWYVFNKVPGEDNRVAESRFVAMSGQDTIQFVSFGTFLIIRSDAIVPQDVMDSNRCTFFDRVI